MARSMFAPRLGDRYGIESDELTVMVERVGKDQWKLTVKGEAELLFSQPPAFTIRGFKPS